MENTSELDMLIQEVKSISRIGKKLAQLKKVLPGSVSEENLSTLYDTVVNLNASLLIEYTKNPEKLELLFIINELTSMIEELNNA